ncbi:MAG: ABC transporter ATP-binding protein [Gemmatimonadales bacterium]
MSSSLPSPPLELHGIDKRFGPVRALTAVDFSLAPGEFHALLGENGAGKSTLMHIAFGMQHPDRGVVLLDGRPCGFRSPRDARRSGLGMVHQHFTSVPGLTVAENIALAAGWAVQPRSLLARVRELMARMRLELDPGRRVALLTVAEKQRLEILKALAGDTRILLLDEPTAVLSLLEAEELLAVIRRYTEQGGAAVLITHKLEEALRATDRVTVLRRGAVTFTGLTAGQTPTSLAAHMIGADLVRRPVSRDRAIGPARITCEELDVARERGPGLAVRQASLEVFGGEIVGIAGVEGNGQRELLRVIAGLRRPAAGRLKVSPPVAFVPEDRTTEGLVYSFTLVENVVLGTGANEPWIRGAWLDWTQARRSTEELMRSFGIQAPSPETTAQALSGGNQQKLVVARALMPGPQVVVAENPTRGLDVRATWEIQARLREATASGASVLVYSSDLDEVLELADRTYVLVEGRLRATPRGATRAEVGAMMLGGGS